VNCLSQWILERNHKSAWKNIYKNTSCGLWTLGLEGKNGPQNPESVKCNSITESIDKFFARLEVVDSVSVGLPCDSIEYAIPEIYQDGELFVVKAFQLRRRQSIFFPAQHLFNACQALYFFEQLPFRTTILRTPASLIMTAQFLLSTPRRATTSNGSSIEQSFPFQQSIRDYLLVFILR